MSVSVISLGAAVQAINVPGKDGTTVDVTPGFTTAKGMLPYAVSYKRVSYKLYTLYDT